MAVNLAIKYSAKVAERFKQAALSTAFTNKDYDWTGVKTLNVYSIDTVAMGDYTRSGSSRYGTPTELGDTKQEMTVTKDRAFTFTIDKGNQADQMNVKAAGKALRRQIDERITPEIDKYVFGKMGQGAVDHDQAIAATLSKQNVYEKFLALQTLLTNALVPLTGRVAAINATTYALLKQDSSFIKSGDLSYKTLINGQVGELDGVKLVLVPDSWLPTNCSMIIAHPSVTVRAEKLEDYKVHQDPPGINGNLVEGRVYYDAFILDAKAKGIAAIYSTLPSKTQASA